RLRPPGARLQRAADHRLHDIVWRRGSACDGRNEAAVPKDGYPIAEAKYLGKPVRNVDDRDACGLQAVQNPEQLLRLCGGQRGRRLVESEDAAVERERARDLEQLTMRERQSVDAGMRRNTEMQAFEQLRRAIAHVAIAEDTEDPGQLAAGEDVGSDA